MLSHCDRPTQDGAVAAAAEAAERMPEVAVRVRMAAPDASRFFSLMTMPPDGRVLPQGSTFAGSLDDDPRVMCSPLLLTVPGDCATPPPVAWEVVPLLVELRWRSSWSSGGDHGFILTHGTDSLGGEVRLEREAERG